MQRLVLFDIDNTLISIGAGNLPQRQAMNAAFERAHGIPDAFDDVPFTGSMDLPLMMEVYRKWGLMTEESETPPDMSAFKAVYFEGLARNLNDWLGGSICPGVPDLLAALDADPRVQLGLETGNFGRPPSSSWGGMGWTVTSGRAGSVGITWRSGRLWPPPSNAVRRSPV